MKDATLVCAAGRPQTDSRGDARARPVNPPVERASTYLFSSYASLNEIAPTGRYGRFGTPTHRAFEESVTALEGAYATHLAPSGLMAVAAAILAFVEAGDHVLITDSVYDPVRAFADGFLQRFGVRVDYYGPCSPADAARLSNPRTKVIFAESPGSLTFEVQDVRALAQVARRSGAALIVDNTWAAGIALKPLALGAQVSVQAGTKYLSGHSDVMIGAISSADAEAAARIQNSLALIGAAISPDDVALAHRGLRTLGARFERCGDNGMQVARWLSQRPEVARVLHPALETHPQHDLWKRDFMGAAGLFAIVLAPTPEPAIAAFFDALEVFGIGFSWGGYESLAVRVRPDRTRTAKLWPEADVVIRFHAGQEYVGDLVADLDRAFAAMKKMAQKTEPLPMMPRVVVFMVLLLAGPIAVASHASAQEAARGAPELVGPSAVGIRPNTPFLHLVGVARREGELRFSARRLPHGLTLDPASGLISGPAPETPGAYDVELRVANRWGSDSARLRIVVGQALALTPPMGWNSWNSVEAEISETVVHEIADALERSGLRDAGYVYINLDDHWADLNRELVVYENNISAEWRMRADRARFPRGLRPIADTLHARGFRLGVYSDAGVTTCAEAQPGGYGYEEVDARTFAEWGVDYVKYDYCYAPSNRDAAIDRYTRMGRALEATDRSIVYSICEWGVRAPWEWARQAGGHLWRTTGDMRGHWEFEPGRDPVRRRGIGVLDAIDLQIGLERHHGPGSWNDPDMLIIGVGLVNSAAHLGARGLSPTEERSMMSLWALMAAPLILNADVRRLDPQNPRFDVEWAARILPILANHEVIAVDQDPLGLQAVRVAADGDADIWVKRLNDGATAVGLLNRGAAPMRITARWSDLGISGSHVVRDLWAHRDLGVFNGEWSATVAPHEVVLVKLSARARS